MCNYSFYRGGGHFSDQYFMCIKLPQICQQESPGHFSQKIKTQLNFSISLVGVGRGAKITKISQITSNKDRVVMK